MQWWWEDWSWPPSSVNVSRHIIKMMWKPSRSCMCACVHNWFSHSLSTSWLSSTIWTVENLVVTAFDNKRRQVRYTLCWTDLDFYCLQYSFLSTGKTDLRSTVRSTVDAFAQDMYPPLALNSEKQFRKGKR